MNRMFNDLSYLIGEQVLIMRGNSEKDNDDSYVQPDRIIVKEVHPRTILLEMTYTGSFLGLKTEPRKIRRSINLASMFCGDVKIRRVSDKRLLTGAEIKIQKPLKGGSGKPGGFGNSTYLQEGYKGY